MYDYYKILKWLDFISLKILHNYITCYNIENEEIQLSTIISLRSLYARPPEMAKSQKNSQK
jgi:hypothetical protein